MCFKVIIFVFICSASYNKNVLAAPQDAQTMALMAAGTAMEVMNNGAGAHMQKSVEVMGMHTSGGFGVGFGEAGKARQRREIGGRSTSGLGTDNDLLSSDSSESYDSSESSDSSSSSSSEESSSDSTPRPSSSSGNNRRKRDISPLSSLLSSADKRYKRDTSDSSSSSSSSSSEEERRRKRDAHDEYADNDSNETSDSAVSFNTSEEERRKRSTEIVTSNKYSPRFIPKITGLHTRETDSIKNTKASLTGRQKRNIFEEVFGTV